MTINISNLSGGGGAVKLAPNLTFPDDIAKQQNVPGYIQVTGIDASAGLTTVLSLTGGKWIINYLKITGLTGNENYTIKLTIDGQVVWNVQTSYSNVGFTLIGALEVFEPVQCEESFLFEVESTTDTDIGCEYLARPIL